MVPNPVADQQCLYHVNNSIILLKIWTISKYMRLGTRPLSGVISTLYNWMNSPISSTKNNMTTGIFAFFLTHGIIFSDLLFTETIKSVFLSNIKCEYFYSTKIMDRVRLKEFIWVRLLVRLYFILVITEWKATESDYWYGCTSFSLLWSERHQ